MRISQAYKVLHIAYWIRKILSGNLHYPTKLYDMVRRAGETNML